MAVRSIETEQARTVLLAFLVQHKLPFVIETTTGKGTSIKQNKLQHKWFAEISDELGESPEYWRAYCKLHYGVPIRRETSEKFRKAYDEDIKPLPYELKLKLMMVPHDMPITRDMTTKQMKRYLDEVQKHFLQRGVPLTDPESAKWRAFEEDNGIGASSRPPARE